MFPEFSHPFYYALGSPEVSNHEAPTLTTISLPHSLVAAEPPRWTASRHSPSPAQGTITAAALWGGEQGLPALTFAQCPNVLLHTWGILDPTGGCTPGPLPGLLGLHGGAERWHGARHPRYSAPIMPTLTMPPSQPSSLIPRSKRPKETWIIPTFCDWNH